MWWLHRTWAQLVSPAVVRNGCRGGLGVELDLDRVPAREAA